MNKLAAIEMQKIVIWTISILVLLAILMFTLNNLAPGTEGSVTNSTFSRLFDLKP